MDLLLNSLWVRCWIYSYWYYSGHLIVGCVVVGDMVIGLFVGIYVGIILVFDVGI